MPGTLTFCGVLGLSAVLALSHYLSILSAHSLEWDSGSFLTNGAVYAGYNQFSQAYDPTRPPFVPFLISLVFRISGPSAAGGYAVSSVLYFFGVVATFLLAKRAMSSSIFAALASVAFALAPQVFEWSGIVVSDVEGVSVAMMALTALVYACESNPRLLLLALPLMVLAPLTRYSMASVFVAAAVYLAASGSLDRLLDHFEFYYGFALGIVAFVVAGIQWVSYPFVNHLGVLSLFPSPDSVNPFHNSLGRAFYLFNFGSVLGRGMFGTIIALAFLLSAVYALLALVLPAARKDHNSAATTSPIIYALISWFALMFFYYSLVWPYDDLRYSIEFVGPAVLVAFWGFSRLASLLYSLRLRTHHRALGVGVSLVLILLMLAPLTFVTARSGMNVYNTTPPLEGSLNDGLRQASAWLYANVPFSDKIESNWYTLLWWYAPQYNVTPAPLAYQISSQASYITWFQQITRNGVSYIVYVDPSQIRIPAGFVEVFHSTIGNVAVYRMAFA